MPVVCYHCTAFGNARRAVPCRVILNKRVSYAQQGMRLHLMRRFVISFAFPALLLALSSPTTAAQKPASHKPPEAQDKYPSILSREIRHQILMLPFFSVFDSISFTIDGSRVTLTGQVVRRTLRNHAAAAVQSIEGVAIVVNNIEVLPVSPADDDLRRAV